MLDRVGASIRPPTRQTIKKRPQKAMKKRDHAYRPKRRLGREGAPLGQRGGASLFVNLAGDEMALLIEMVVDLGMN